MVDVPIHFSGGAAGSAPEGVVLGEDAGVEGVIQGVNRDKREVEQEAEHGVELSVSFDHELMEHVPRNATLRLFNIEARDVTTENQK